MRQAIRSENVVTPEGTRPATVVFEKGCILAVEPGRTELGDIQVLDVQQQFVLPGLIDSHVHINSPGRSEWEGFETASRAAAAGGYTCLIDMPLNSVPPTNNIEGLEAKRKAARNASIVDYAFWGGAVKENVNDIPKLAQAGVKGFKSFLVDPGVSEFTAMTVADLHIAMPVIASTGLPLLVHAEDAGIIAAAQTEVRNEPPRLYATYLRSRPDEAECAAIDSLIRLCLKTRTRIHIVHLSTAKALPALYKARAVGLPITVETCPHYLCFAAESIPDGATSFKCAPPIRSEANRELLWDALRESLIDMVTTDHSPCTPALKCNQRGDFVQAWGGIASLSVALSAVWTEARGRGFALSDIALWMSKKTGELAGLADRKGEISPGKDADFVVFDPNRPFIVRKRDLYFRHPVSPYLGKHLIGRVTMTICRGVIAYADGQFPSQSCGRECVELRYPPTNPVTN